MNPDLWLRTLRLYLETLQSAVSTTSHTQTIETYKTVYNTAQQTEHIFKELFEEMIETLQKSQQRALHHIAILKQNETPPH
jgi:hypothetical protein